MSESDGTHSDQIHRIFISAPKAIADRTGLYIIILLCFLLFLLIFYLIYNFISYKRYCSIRRKHNLHCYSEKSLSNKQKLKTCLYSHEQLILQSHYLPLRIATSLPIRQNFEKIRHISLSNRPYPMTNYLVSDL